MACTTLPLKKARQAAAIAFCFIALLAASALAGQESFSPPPGAKLVTPEQIMAGLPKAPIAVGFDVDDTLLFSSPGYYYGATNTDGPGGSNKYGADYHGSKAFWVDMNSRLGQFSIPKLVAGEALRRHFARGDRIYIITARPPSRGEKVSALLQRVFKVKLAGPAIFTNGKDKGAHIAKLGIKVFYGDSDGEISAALKAGAGPSGC